LNGLLIPLKGSERFLNLLQDPQSSSFLVFEKKPKQRFLVLAQLSHKADFSGIVRPEILGQNFLAETIRKSEVNWAAEQSRFQIVPNGSKVRFKFPE